VKTWFRQGSAALEKVTVIEDEIQQPFSRETCNEEERVAPFVQDNPYYSTDL